MSNGGQEQSNVLGGIVGLGLLLWVGSCVFGGASSEEKAAQTAQEATASKELEARRASEAARYSGDPLLVEGARASPSGDGVAYTISVLGGRCEKAVSVTPLETPMVYDVICSDGMSGSRMNFIKYRLNTAKGISELMS